MEIIRIVGHGLPGQLDFEVENIEEFFEEEKSGVRELLNALLSADVAMLTTSQHDIISATCRRNDGQIYTVDSYKVFGDEPGHFLNYEEMIEGDKISQTTRIAGETAAQPEVLDIIRSRKETVWLNVEKAINLQTGTVSWRFL